MSKEQLFIQLVNQLSSENLFHGHGVVDAEDEAMMVLMKVFDENVNQILSTGHEDVDDNSISQANAFVESRIKTCKPMAYILEEVYFAQLKFKSDARALVPRSPIAELIINGFEPWLNMNNVSRALDLCTGSGCIGISLAKKYQHVKVDISDLSDEALSLAQENINIHNVNLTAYNSDLFKSIDNKYDLIVTNPPYVSDEEYQALPLEYKQEPKLGLVTEHYGLKIPLKIMLQAPDYLTNKGFLFLEVGYSDECLETSFPQIDFEWVEFLNGGQGVCVFSREKLLEYHSYFKAFLEKNDVL